ITFNEITERAVKAAFTKPGKIDMHKVDAQQARRVLDRLVGYSLSPLLWDKVRRGLSAGRVQSVALRLIVDREREIEAFVPEEYWNIGATLSKSEKKQPFAARLAQEDGKKLEVKDGETAARVKRHLEASAYRIAEIKTSERKRRALAPYTTSKLQQDAVNRLGFTAKRTMQVAQGLY